MFLFYNQRFFVILLIEILLILSDDGTLKRNKQNTVTANLNITNNNIKPFIQIEKRATTSLLITKPHLPHYLPCIVTIDEYYFYYQNKTRYFFTWFHNDEPIEPKHFEHMTYRRNDYILYRNGTLRLPPIERISGSYRCKINADEAAVLSERIIVEYPVLKRNFSNELAASNISAYEGQPLTLHCPMLSVPPSNVTWYFGNATLEKSQKDISYFLLANGSLLLKQLTLKDAGKYKCSAQNQFSVKTHRQFIWTLKVEPHSIQTIPGASLLPPLQNNTQYVEQGKQLRLECRTIADSVTIEWWYQRTPNDTLYKIANNSAVYQLSNVSMQANEGYYICVTSHDKQIYHLIVTIPPRITEHLRVYEGLITASVTFRCIAEGNPRPALTWYHNGALLNSSYTRYISGYDLYIHSFDPEEQGIYQCFARSIAGEDYTTGEIRYQSNDELHKPLQHIRCYAHSFNTINVTFDSSASESFFIVHIVQSNPHRWISPFEPKKLNHTSYVVITSHLPVYRPFALITRLLFPTSEIRAGRKAHQQTILSSLRSPPVMCSTQGLLLHLVHIENDTFVTWSQPELATTKYFILQYDINYTRPHPKRLLEHKLSGTITHVQLNSEDVLRKLTTVQPLNETAASAVLRRLEPEVSNNEARIEEQLVPEENIYSIIVPANVTGVLIEKFTHIKMRVLIVTSENEDVKQDFRYVQWKIIENDTTEISDTPFRLMTVESRMLVFHFLDSYNETCVLICNLQIHFPYIKKEEPKCERGMVEDSLLVIRSLKANERYRLQFFSCEPQIYYGQLDVQTLPDPPGTISNQRVTRHNGLKLSWDPPLQPNGRVHHYNILWTLGNVTHEANVLECSVCFYKFPNITETAKINVTVRVVGETGVGAPIFIDLRNINHHTLEIERNNTNSEVFSGIAIGSLLSTCCVFCFALLIIFQRRRFKARQQGPTHLSTPTDINFGNLSHQGIAADSAGGLSGSTLQQDCHEMQTLIPRSRYQIELLPEHRVEYQTTQLPNGNGSLPRRQQTTSPQDCFDTSIVGVQNLSQIPLCKASPERTEPQEAFYIPFKHTPPNAVATQSLQKQQSSFANTSATSGSGLGLGVKANANVGNIGIVGNASEIAIMPPSSLPLVSNVPFISSTRRSGSLSSSSASSSSNGCKKQYHTTNFPKHSNSNDGICLLAEEESAATLTPTSENEIACAMLTNGFKITTAADIAIPESGSSTEPTTNQSTNLNNNNALSKRAGGITNTNTNTNTKLKGYNTTKKQQQQQQQQPLPQQQQSHSQSSATYINNTNIVPDSGLNDAATSQATSSKYWMPTSSTTANAATDNTSVTNNLHRRPQVDPNG